MDTVDRCNVVNQMCYTVRLLMKHHMMLMYELRKILFTHSIINFSHRE